MDRGAAESGDEPSPSCGRRLHNWRRSSPARVGSFPCESALYQPPPAPRSLPGTARIGSQAVLATCTGAGRRWGGFLPHVHQLAEMDEAVREPHPAEAEFKHPAEPQVGGAAVHAAHAARCPVTSSLPLGGVDLLHTPACAAEPHFVKMCSSVAQAEAPAGSGTKLPGAAVRQAMAADLPHLRERERARPLQDRARGGGVEPRAPWGLEPPTPLATEPPALLQSCTVDFLKARHGSSAWAGRCTLEE